MSRRFSIPLLWFGLLGCQRVPVQSGLDERSANEVVLALEESGIAVDKESDAAQGNRGQTWSLLVSGSDAAHAFQVLADRELPRRDPPGFEELLSTDRLIPTSGEERTRTQHALTGELTRSLESIRGVLEARIHLAVPEPDPLADPATRTPPSASLLLKVNQSPLPVSEENLRALIAGAVEGLHPNRVTVVIVAQPAPERPPTDGLVSVAGLRVAPQSAVPLRFALLGAVLLNLALAVISLVLFVRRRTGTRPMEASS